MHETRPMFEIGGGIWCELACSYFSGPMLWPLKLIKGYTDEAVAVLLI